MIFESGQDLVYIWNALIAIQDDVSSLWVTKLMKYQAIQNFMELYLFFY